MSIWNRRRPNPPKPKPPTPFESRLSVWKDGQLSVEGVATLRLDQFPGQSFAGVKAPEDPRWLFVLPPETFRENGGNFTLTGVEGFADVVDRRCMIASDLRVEHADGTPAGDVALEPLSKDFDPSTVPLRELARIRGGMWTKLPFELPARPDQPRMRDIAGTDFLFNYSEADRERMLAHLRDQCRYTHAEVGPVVDSDGYHGTWTPNNWLTRWDEWLDMHQYMWNRGIAPISFIVPDNWSLERAKAEITPYLLRERSQRLIRIAVIAWEPGGGYTWSSHTWAGFAKWLGECLPNALILMHNASKDDGSAPDAPVGTDAAGDDNGQPNGVGFSRVAPYIHGWLIQTGNYTGP